MEAERGVYQGAGRCISQQSETKKEASTEAYALNLTGLIKCFLRCSMEEITVIETGKSDGKGWIEGLNNINGGIVEFKIHVRRVYEVVYNGQR